jgi:hypothetical protein
MQQEVNNAKRRAICMKNAWTASYARLSANNMPNGVGSIEMAVRDTKRELPILMEKWSLESVSDVGCGDATWIMDSLDGQGITYHGYDFMGALITSNKSSFGADKFTELNALDTASFPTRDLILCRDVMIHMGAWDVVRMLELFKDSGSKYLLTTTYPNEVSNPEVISPQIYRGGGCGYVMWNLEAAPFNLVEVDKIEETHRICRGRKLMLIDLASMVVPSLT